MSVHRPMHAFASSLLRGDAGNASDASDACAHVYPTDQRLCGLALARHRKDTRKRSGRKGPNGTPRIRKPNTPKQAERQSERRREVRATKARARDIIGIDGEGHTLANGEHLYTYLAASTSTRLVGEVENKRGLSTEEVFDFLLSLPQNALIFGFSLGYDRTKWFENLPPWMIYYLDHPEARPGEHGPAPVRWTPERSTTTYKINRLSTKFSLAIENPDHESKKRSLRRIVVWDLFKFYQCAFVTALEKWEVGTEAERAQILAMKEQRGNFSSISEQEKEYCRHECRLLAQLAEKLITAHDEAGLELTSYYGPGSTASLMLKMEGAKEQKAKIPARMQRAAHTAFFGGRFEQAVTGPVRKPVYGADIASAYPYAIYKLPCMKHGKWKRIATQGRRNTRTPLVSVQTLLKQIREAPAACVRYKLVKYKGSDRAVWGPLPMRHQDGNITFPITGPGGWVWRDEFLAARRFAPNVIPWEAWIFTPSTGCKCGDLKHGTTQGARRPFAAHTARFYNLRLEWGKDGRGIVVKLGLNSKYGKRAQRIGDNPPFACIVAAGMITSSCRAQLLDAMGTTFNDAVLCTATDGVLFQTKPANLAAPEITQTEKLAAEKGKYPLGAWEPKDYPHGVFLLRPGIRFSLDPQTKRTDTAARGLGVNVLHKNREHVVTRWNEEPMGAIAVQQPALFHGSMSAIAFLEGKKGQEEDGVFVRREEFGKWFVPPPRKLDYRPDPKRAEFEKLSSDEKYNGPRRMKPWHFDPNDFSESAVYGDTPSSKLAEAVKLFDKLQEDQPSGERVEVFERYER